MYRGVPIDQGLIRGDSLNQCDWAIVLVLDLTHDLLHDVLQGHDPGHPPVFVDHHGHVHLLFLELTQEDVDRLGRRGIVDRAEESVQGWIWGVHLGEEVLRVEGPHHVVGDTVVDREPRVSICSYDLPRLDRRGPHLDRLHIGARNHHLLGGHLVEVEDAAYHLSVLSVDQAALLARVDQRLDLFIAHGEGLLLREILPKDPHDPIGDPTEDHDERLQETGEEVDLVDRRQREPLGVILGEVLRRDLPKDEERDRHHPGRD